MLGAGVDLQLRDLLPREPVLREHPLDRDAQHLGRAPVELLAQRAAAQAAGIARVAVVPLLVELVARDLDLLRVHDDHEVAGVDVRRVLRLPLAAERVGDLGRETAERLALGVDEIPLARDLSRLGAVGLHRKRRTRGPPAADCSESALAIPARMRPLRRATGWRTYGASSAAAASRPTAIATRPRVTSSRNGAAASTSARVGRAIRASRVPGCVGTTFQSSTSSSTPSPASTRWTIVALASAGPEPVSWRSDVNANPADARAAVAGRLADEDDPRVGARRRDSREAAPAGAPSRRTGCTSRRSRAAASRSTSSSGSTGRPRPARGAAARRRSTRGPSPDPRRDGRR